MYTTITVCVCAPKVPVPPPLTTPLHSGIMLLEEHMNGILTEKINSFLMEKVLQEPGQPWVLNATSGLIGERSQTSHNSLCKLIACLKAV